MFHPFRLVRCVLMGANARAALGSPMASVVFTRGHFGTTHAADRLRARESTAECMQGRTRVVMGRPRARIRAHARTAKSALRASAVCVVFCSSLAPVWRARANSKTRDYSDNDAPTKWGYSCRWLYVTVTDTLNRYLRFGMN